jgi:hypothetical protein
MYLYRFSPLELAQPLVISVSTDSSHLRLAASLCNGSEFVPIRSTIFIPLHWAAEDLISLEGTDFRPVIVYVHAECGIRIALIRAE